MSKRSKRLMLGLESPQAPKQVVERLDEGPGLLERGGKAILSLGAQAARKGLELGGKGLRQGAQLAGQQLHQLRERRRAATAGPPLRVVPTEEAPFLQLQDGFLHVRDPQFGERLVNEVGLAGVKTRSGLVILGSYLDGKPRKLIVSNDRSHQIQPLAEEDIEVLTSKLREMVWDVEHEGR